MKAPSSWYLIALALALGLRPAAAGVTWEHLEQSIVAEPDQKPTRVPFRFTNTSEAPLKVLEIHRCCGLGAEDPPAKDFAPGEKGEIVVWLYPKGATHAYTSDFKVTTEDGVTTKLKIHVDIPDFLSLQSESLTWKQGETPAAKTADVHIKGSLHAVKNLVVKNAPGSPFTTDMAAVEPGRRYRLTVTPKSTAAPISASIRIDAETTSKIPAAAVLRASVQP